MAAQPTSARTPLLDIDNDMDNDVDDDQEVNIEEVVDPEVDPFALREDFIRLTTTQPVENDSDNNIHDDDDATEETEPPTAEDFGDADEFEDENVEWQSGFADEEGSEIHVVPVVNAAAREQSEEEEEETVYDVSGSDEEKHLKEPAQDDSPGVFANKHKKEVKPDDQNNTNIDNHTGSSRGNGDKSQLYLTAAGLCCCLSLVAIIVILSVVLTGNGNGNTQKSAPSTSAPTPTPPPKTYVLDLPVYSMEAMQSNIHAPASLAYEWLEKDPNLDNYNQERRLQRYAMATLYYATRGANWTLPRYWLSYDTHECWWWQQPLEDTPSRDDEEVKDARWACWHDNEDEADPNATATTPTATVEQKNIFQHNNNNNEKNGLRQRQRRQQQSLSSQEVPARPSWGLRRLHLPNNNLLGRLPRELALLSHLESIDVSHNTIFGNGLTGEGTFRHMKALNLSHNLLTGSLLNPSSFSVVFNWQAMDQLETLDLAYNQLNESLPWSSLLAALPKLGELNLAYNNFTGPLQISASRDDSDGVNTSNSLMSLQLQNNQLTGTINSDAIGTLTHLRHLAADGNRLRGWLPTTLGLLTNLQELLLFDNQLSGQLPTQLGAMTEIRVVGLNGNQFAGRLPSELGRLTLLEELWLYDNAMTGLLPSSLGDLVEDHRLQYLILYGNTFTGQISSKLCKLDDFLQFDCSMGKLCGCGCSCVTYNYTDDNDNEDNEDDEDDASEESTNQNSTIISMEDTNETDGNATVTVIDSDNDIKSPTSAPSRSNEDDGAEGQLETPEPNTVPPVLTLSPTAESTISFTTESSTTEPIETATTLSPTESLTTLAPTESLSVPPADDGGDDGEENTCPNSSRPCSNSSIEVVCQPGDCVYRNICFAQGAGFSADVCSETGNS